MLLVGEPIQLLQGEVLFVRKEECIPLAKTSGYHLPGERIYKGVSKAVPHI